MSLKGVVEALLVDEAIAGNYLMSAQATNGQSQGGSGGSGNLDGSGDSAISGIDVHLEDVCSAMDKIENRLNGQNGVDYQRTANMFYQQATLKQISHDVRSGLLLWYVTRLFKILKQLYMKTRLQVKLEIS